jgi:hypothetical protein
MRERDGGNAAEWGHGRQERATEAYRPDAPLRQSALLRVPLPLRLERADLPAGGAAADGFAAGDLAVAAEGIGLS